MPDDVLRASSSWKSQSPPEERQVQVPSITPPERQLPENAQGEMPPGIKLYLTENQAQWLTETSRRARMRLDELRRQAQRWRRQYPGQTMLAIAGIAFVIGIVLRSRRATSD